MDFGLEKVGKKRKKQDEPFIEILGKLKPLRMSWLEVDLELSRSDLSFPCFQQIAWE